jgi:hypothetical protein
MCLCFAAFPAIPDDASIEAHDGDDDAPRFLEDRNHSRQHAA